MIYEKTKSQFQAITLRPILLIVTLLVLLAAPSLAQNRCFICSSQKGVRQIKIGSSTEKICQTCRAQKETCEVCRRPGQGILRSDGRSICKRCAQNVIMTQQELESLYDGVKRFLARDQTGVLVDFELPVKLADKDEFDTKLNEGGRAVSAVGFYHPYNPEQIYMLSGRDKVETAGTLVHEYTHAWQSRNCPSQDRAMKEGFACYIQYRYLVSIGQRYKAQALTRHQDPDYGASLRALLELEKKVGVQGVVKHARNERDLPK